MLRPALLRSRRTQGGLSLVEMMVGVAIGLIIVAAASLVVSTQLLENRKLITEMQLQQDLRAAADIVTRELRRAGIWGSDNANQSVWYSGTTAVKCNQYTTVTPDSKEASVVTYRYWRSSNQNGALGFQVVNGVLQYSLTVAETPPNNCTVTNSPSNWQDLTDGRTMTITDFKVETANGPVSQIWCPKLCSDSPPSTKCWPTIQVRELTVRIEGQSAYDASVKRSVTSTVRLRNDYVKYGNPAVTDQACPS